jgi:aminotransferase
MRTAARVSRFRESVIREMTRLAMSTGAVNLSQGFPDFDPPPAVVEAASRAIAEGHNQYTVTWGFPALRDRLAHHHRDQLGWDVDPDRHVSVTCGVTEAIACAFLGLLDPGDEVLVIEPAHETYGPAAFLADAVPVPVVLEPPGFRIDGDRLAAAVTPRTRALLLNTPHNPTGRVLDLDELAIVADLAERHDLVVVTDEIYDRITYDGRDHVPPGRLAPLAERTVTIGGLGKTFAMTGWRLGHIIAPSSLAGAVRGAHDFLTICAPTPLQAAAVAAMDLGEDFYRELTAAYHERRATFCDALAEAGFGFQLPEGAYYVMADFSGLRPDLDDVAFDDFAFARHLTVDVGVACVPGTVFYTDPAHGREQVRFAFAKRLATLEEARARLLAAFG